MKNKIQNLLNSVNHRFDKVHYLIKKNRSIQSLDKTLRSEAEKYKEEINKIQELYSTKKNKISINHHHYELVACSIGAKGNKYSALGTSYKILPNYKYLLKIRTELNKLGVIGSTSNITKSSNIIGKCAEIKASNNLLKRESNLEVDNITFTRAIRPRTLENIPRCKNCVNIFGNEN